MGGGLLGARKRYELARRDAHALDHSVRSPDASVPPLVKADQAGVGLWFNHDSTKSYVYVKDIIKGRSADRSGPPSPLFHSFPLNEMNL
jgi:hypothetical protein